MKGAMIASSISIMEDDAWSADAVRDIDFEAQLAMLQSHIPEI